MDIEKINDVLKGSFDPEIAGFTITRIRSESKAAAAGGIDFSTLFLSLGVFILLSCIILLSFAVSIFFDSRKEQVRTYHALGFKNIFIKKILFLETMFYTVIGAVPGVFIGFLMNKQIIGALNSVWKGAVQTDTITAQFGFLPVATGFVATVIISAVLLVIKVRAFLKNLSSAEKGQLHIRREKKSLLFLFLSFLAASIILILSFLLRDSSTVLSFISGSLFFLSFVLALRQYYIGHAGTKAGSMPLLNHYSRKFYSFYPSKA
jgi:putative ABC transport system permease protein